MMKTVFLIASLWAFSGSLVVAKPCPELLNHTMTKLRSTEQIDFCQAFQGKVILVVNTASNCGYTPQFKGLEALYQKYKDNGLVVLGFPSNDFNQEFEEAEKTANVCYINYGVTFPMMEKSQVKGAAANGFFQKLFEATGEAPAWNFHKYLIDRTGTSVAAFPSNVTPEQLDSKVSALLSAK
ncbi:glutathione peroxidase [Methylocucumis oryzae]|uniref:Glutathione peroxidase n=1 Tax=Methylocucumis oryzae TaxID=1632867 RepID=A0A0F3IG12_9GAMM|nr:glutathione peroxidase [Methylocucumis oryzae]KJV05617.1 glutathione peroxidase [Methylocucumis oryzae]